MGTAYRHEYKYSIHSGQAALLEARTAAILQRDPHVAETGNYVVKSLYFDDYQDTCFWENEDGYDLRFKFRIRYYDNNTDYIRLEKKSKQNGMTQKESCLITKEMCQSFMAGQIPQVHEDMPQKMKKLFTEMRLANMVPKVIVIYERRPYIYPAGNIRITFDRNIASSNDIGNFLNTNIIVRPIMKKGESLMEVKWDEVMPEHIYHHLALDKLQWTSFSKYYNCRKYDCYGGYGV